MRRNKKNTDKDYRWFLIPEYKIGEGWQVVNFHGELVATFQIFEEAQFVVKLFNQK